MGSGLNIRAFRSGVKLLLVLGLRFRAGIRLIARLFLGIDPSPHWCPASNMDGLGRKVYRAPGLIEVDAKRTDRTRGLVPS